MLVLVPGANGNIADERAVARLGESARKLRISPKLLVNKPFEDAKEKW